MKDNYSDNEYLEKLTYSMQQRNLVYNYNFLYFSNSAVDGSGRIIYNHPDGWIYNDPGSGAHIGLEKDSCRIVTSSDDQSRMSFKQALHEFPRWKSILQGKTVSAYVSMNISANSSVTVSLADGVVKNSKTLQSQGSVIVELQLKIAANAEEFYIEIESRSNSSVINIYKVYANIGDIPVENLPCIVSGIIGERKQYVSSQIPPAEELSLCEASRELEPNQTRLSSVLNGRFGTGQQYNLSLLPDMRGLFSRAWNNGSGIDPDASTRKISGNEAFEGDYVGTNEVDTYKEHNHGLNFVVANVAYAGAVSGINTAGKSSTELSGDAETRPKNIAELYTIKWA